MFAVEQENTRKKVYAAVTAAPRRRASVDVHYAAHNPQRSRIGFIKRRKTRRLDVSGGRWCSGSNNNSRRQTTSSVVYLVPLTRTIVDESRCDTHRQNYESGASFQRTCAPNPSTQLTPRHLYAPKYTGGPPPPPLSGLSFGTVHSKCLEHIVASRHSNQTGIITFYACKVKGSLIDMQRTHLMFCCAWKIERRSEKHN